MATDNSQNKPAAHDPPSASPSVREPLDEWLRRELLAECGPGREPDPWAATEVSRIMERLSAVRTGGRPLAAEILWVQEVTAFTLPGHYIYISRRLLERCGTDDPVAFALAHEIAHHDLGHLHGIDDLAASVPRGMPGLRTGRLALTLALLLIERRVHGPEKEADADRFALELCRSAGYDLERCIHAFDILEADALDQGDLDGVFGLEDALDTSVNGGGHAWLPEAREWLQERLRGYLPIRERKARLRAILKGAM